MTHEYILKQVSPYTGEPHVLYQKEFESSEHAEMYLKPLLEKYRPSPPPCLMLSKRSELPHKKPRLFSEAEPTYLSMILS